MVAGTSLIQSNTTPTSLSTANSPLQWEFEDRDNHGRGHLLENRPINGGSQFVNKLEALVKQIPESIPSDEGGI
jgi:hypothetical protein